MSVVARRRGLVEWAISDSTHAVDLAPNRHDSLGLTGLERMFGQFCLEVDRYLLGVKHVHLRSSHDRLLMIAFPEKLDVNPHLHGFANFSLAHWGNRIDQLPWEWKLGEIWRCVSGGSGTIDIVADPDAGKVWYSTKEAFRRDHDYLHSWDFHRPDKLTRRPSAVCLQRKPAIRRPRTH